MSDEPNVKDIIDSVKGIVEAVPVYQDAIQPAAKELGVALQTVVKTVNVALAPVSVLIWGFEKIKDFVNQSVGEKLQSLPESQIISPSPTIAGPTLEALRFSGHDPDLREMFAKLLATSMDSNTAVGAHPAFVEIIKQLSADEAKILNFLSNGNGQPIIAVRGERKDGTGGQDIARHFSTLAEDSNCQNISLCPNYLDNLSRLGLIIIEQKQIVKEGAYDEIENHPKLMKIKEEVENHDLIYTPSRHVLYLTDLGKLFCYACVQNNTHTY